MNRYQVPNHISSPIYIMYNVHVWHDCRRIQYTPSPCLEIILPVRLFVLFGYPLRGVNIGNLPLLTVKYGVDADVCVNGETMTHSQTTIY